MDTYSFLRELADSWVLLAMFTFFLLIAVWAFLPSQRANREDASMIPFRNEDGPASGAYVEPRDSESLSSKVKGHTDV